MVTQTAAIAVARLAWENLVRECGSDPVSEENAILSVGDEFLPAFARAVRDGGEATVQYYAWLVTQTAQAQAEHDAEYAAGVLA